MDQTTNIITKVALAHIKDGKLLCVRTKGLELFYNVGGKPELGESLEDALVRESKEEISVDLKRDTIKFLVEFSGPGVDKAKGKTVVFKLYTAQFDGEPKVSEEIEEMAYLDMNDLDKLPHLGKMAMSWLFQQDMVNGLQVE